MPYEYSSLQAFLRDLASELAFVRAIEVDELASSPHTITLRFICEESVSVEEILPWDMLSRNGWESFVKSFLPSLRNRIAIQVAEAYVHRIRMIKSDDGYLGILHDQGMREECPMRLAWGAPVPQITRWIPSALATDTWRLDTAPVVCDRSYDIYQLARYDPLLKVAHYQRQGTR